MIRRSVQFAAASLAWMSIGASQVWACPMCKLALESDDPQPRAYMYSILFMLCTIGAVFGGMIAFLYWVAKNERAVMDAAGYQHLFENGVSEQAAPRME